MGFLCRNIGKKENLRKTMIKCIVNKLNKNRKENKIKRKGVKITPKLNFNFSYNLIKTKQILIKQQKPMDYLFFDLKGL